MNNNKKLALSLSLMHHPSARNTILADDVKSLSLALMGTHHGKNAVKSIRLSNKKYLISSFFDAVIAGHAKKVSTILSTDPSLARVRRNDGDMALHVAAFRCDVPMIRALIAGGAPLNARDVDARNGSTPLHIAIGRASDRVSISGRVVPKETKLKAVQVLLDAGADVNVKSDLDDDIDGGNTPMHTAASYNDIESFKMLLSHGASVRIKNAEGKTPLEMISNPKNLMKFVNYIPTSK